MTPKKPDPAILQLDGVGLRGHAYRATAKIGKLQREKHFKFDAENVRKKILAWQDETRSALRKKRQPSGGKRGAFNVDAQRYLDILKPTVAASTYDSRVCEIDAWVALIGSEPTDGISRDDILDARHHWLTKGKGKRTGQMGASVKTVINRERALHHLFSVLYGKKAPTPLDDIEPLEPPKANPIFVPIATIAAVLKKLTDPVTRARFMVLVSTGQRPAQLKRAQPEDVDLVRRLWSVRRAKGGNPIPVVLTDDMTAAWEAFIAADAWGAFDGSDYAKALYAAGWPTHVRPYNAKHTTAITLAESGAEWEDIKDWFGHTDVKTTRIYTGLIAARTRTVSARLHGRFGWKSQTASQLPAKTGGTRRNMAESGGIARGKKKGRSAG